ncbi:glycosyltransferase [Sphingobacterium spiritivorum]|uniref:glycosyltransferase n=2 Tax=Sphingobacterium spiritivorum TaxID=258 RepID=UPI003DA20D52
MLKKINLRLKIGLTLDFMQQQNVLIIGLVWPEPTSSAAGLRMQQLIELFLQHDLQVVFACAAQKSAYSLDLAALGVEEAPILLNDPSFDTFIQELNPAMVVFDRFMIEEQYGWRVTQHCPDALKILDTEDLHFLRHARQQNTTDAAPDLYNDVTKRELAAILRSDISLIISETEMDLLTSTFRIDPDILYYLPFLEQEIDDERAASWKTFEERKDMMFIGNFLHEPNWHTVLNLKKNIWPLLRKKMPEVSLYIYGAYPSQKVLQLHNPKERFFIAGRAEDARETMANHRLLIAPIPFGAGIKGKFIDAMQTGTPSVTSSLGAESMADRVNWPGAVEDDINLFTEQVTILYRDREIWNEAQKKGISIINNRYSGRKFAETFIQRLFELQRSLALHRQTHFVGQILQHHTLQSTRYMSLWITEKNK